MEANFKLMKDEAEENADETKFKQIIGSIRLLCNSRPDLAFSVGVIRRFMNKPKKTHMQAAKRVIRYIKGIVDYGYLFPTGRKKTTMEATGYTNSNYGGDPTQRNNTSGYIFMLNDSPISWCSKTQSVVALSSCEAEYITGSFATCQGVWVKELMEELKMAIESSIQLRIDNVSAIDLAKNPISHGRIKHIEVKFHFLKDMVNKGRIVLAYCKTKVQFIDLFTKPLKINSFDFLKESLGIVSLKNLT